MSNVCKDQQTFNESLYQAVEYSRKTSEKKMTGGVGTYLVIHTLFLVWGIVLAFKSQPANNRVMHITMAMVFSPAYVLAYYLNMFDV
jgi:hypothetical protein